jgi:PAS domain S-box-containing protein
MRSRNNKAAAFAVSWAIVVLIALGSLSLRTTEFGQWLEDSLTDYYFQWRGSRDVSGEVVFIRLDDAVLLDKPAWGMEWPLAYARAVDYVASHGARLIVLGGPVTDIPDYTPEAQRPPQARKRETMASFRQSITSAQEHGCRVVIDAPDYTGSTARTGEVSLSDALVIKSGVVRGIATDLVEDRSPKESTLAVLLQQLGIDAGVPADLASVLYVNYSGISSRIEHYSLDKVSEINIEANDDRFRDKIVFIDSWLQPAIKYSIPYTATNPDSRLSAMEIAAEATDTAIVGVQLKPLGLVWIFLITLMFLAISTLDQTRSGSLNILVNAVLLIGVFFLGYYLFTRNLMFPAMDVAIALVANSLVVGSIWRHVVRQEGMELLEQSKTALVERWELLRGVLDTSPSYIHVRDDKGMVVLANRMFASLFHTTPDEVTGQSLTAMMSSAGRDIESPAEILAGDTAIIEQNRFLVDLERFESVTGKVAWYQTTKLPLFLPDGRKCVLVISEDVTTLKQAEEEIRSQHDLLENLFASLEEAIFVVDRELNLVQANRTYFAESGIEEDRYEAGKTRETWLHSGEKCLAPGSRCPVCEVLKTRKSTVMNIRQRVEQWSMRHLEALASPQFDSEGEIASVVVVVRDVTQQRKLEEQLRVAQKLEAIATLAGGISHDFNNILTGIIGYAEMARDIVEPESEISEYIHEVLSASNRATDLVHQILAFSRRREMDKRAIQLQPLVKEVLKLLRASLPTTIDVKQQIDPDSGAVMADPTQMHQVLLNLCTNAAQAMDNAGGLLEVKLEEREISLQEAEDNIELDAGVYVVLSVIDTGSGIPPALKDRIFEPFFTTKEHGVGTGLGLAISHGIVTDAGGVITVDSEVGLGTIFEVYLPRVSKDDTGSVVKHEPQAEYSGNALVIDDEIAIVEVVGTRLESWGFTTTRLTDSMQAMEEFRSNYDRYDIVLTDLTMPGLTGVELAKEIRRLNKEIPIILSSGFSHVATAELVQGHVVDEILIKPITARKLLEAVSRCMGND